MNVIKKIDPISVAKITAVMYLILGYIFIVPFSLIFAALPSEASPFAGLGMGMMLIIPIFYAGVGFVVTLIAAALFNAVSKWVGGIKIEIENEFDVDINEIAREA